MLKTGEIRIRDPFVIAENGLYYLYSSSFAAERLEEYIEDYDEKSLYMVVYRSADLKEWSEPEVVFRYAVTEESELSAELWAPEIHKYRGRYYAFMSFRNRRGIRGTYIAAADQPDGTFVLLEEKPVTPTDQSAIDGTLFVEDGTPYIVYSRDWPFHYVEEKNAYVGEIWAKKLNGDLTGSSEDGFRLFASDDSPISKATPHRIVVDGKQTMRYGSDAPFLMKLSDGRLFMSWSPYLQNNYVVLTAVSESGSIRGPWIHGEEPLFDRNGGHAMFFRDFDGSLKMCVHQPEAPRQERLCCLEAEEKNGAIRLK